MYSYILGSNPSRWHSKVIYRWRVRKREKREKTKKTRKTRREEKVVGFSSVSLFPARKREEVTQGGTREKNHPTWRKTKGAGIVKAWEDKRDRGRISDTFT